MPAAIATTLQHLILNTGHVSYVQRDVFSREEIDEFVPIIGKQGGPTPGLAGWFLSLMFPLNAGGWRKDGAAFFQIAEHSGVLKAPAAMGSVCWREDMAEGAWLHTLQSYAALEQPLQGIGLWRKPPKQRPPAPWLTVWMTPFLVTGDDPKTALGFARAEQALAWALIR